MGKKLDWSEIMEKNPEKAASYDMGGKMENMHSYGTCYSVNPICKARIAYMLDKIASFNDDCAEIIRRYKMPSSDKQHYSKKQCIIKLEKAGYPVDSICVCIFCYVADLEKISKNMKNKYQAVYNWLQIERTISEVPTVKAGYANTFRLESLGDLGSVNQAYNYLLMAEKQPDIKFALWTKNPNFLYQALVKLGHKPNNLQVVLSSPYLNKPDIRNYEKYNKLFPGMIDKIFTVWTEKAAKENSVDMNCCRPETVNTQKCCHCLKCYFKNTIIFINEILR